MQHPAKILLEKHLYFPLEQREACPFYILSKIHEPALKARPITAQQSYILSSLSKKLARILNQKRSSFLVVSRDNKQIVARLVLLKLPNDVNKEFYMVLVT